MPRFDYVSLTFRANAADGKHHPEKSARAPLYSCLLGATCLSPQADPSLCGRALAPFPLAIVVGRQGEDKLCRRRCFCPPRSQLGLLMRVAGLVMVSEAIDGEDSTSSFERRKREDSESGHSRPKSRDRNRAPLECCAPSMVKMLNSLHPSS